MTCPATDPTSLSYLQVLFLTSPQPPEVQTPKRGRRSDTEGKVLRGLSTAVDRDSERPGAGPTPALGLPLGPGACGRSGPPTAPAEARGASARPLCPSCPEPAPGRCWSHLRLLRGPARLATRRRAHLHDGLADLPQTVSFLLVVHAGCRSHSLRLRTTGPAPTAPAPAPSPAQAPSAAALGAVPSERLKAVTFGSGSAKGSPTFLRTAVGCARGVRTAPPTRASETLALPWPQSLSEVVVFAQRQPPPGTAV